MNVDFPAMLGPASQRQAWSWLKVVPDHLCIKGGRFGLVYVWAVRLALCRTCDDCQTAVISHLDVVGDEQAGTSGCLDARMP